MCIICIQFQQSKDLADAVAMLAAARREPSSIPAAHLDEVERNLAQAKKDPAVAPKARP